jgi:adenylate kinase family enzyme
MIIVLNGPLGIGKSTFAEALTESIESSVMLDGDRLVAVNPPPASESSTHRTAPASTGNRRTRLRAAYVR